ncbi:hypothetical protein A6A08_14820 [Nocardiopsis sp. TSRI0078]|uniref:DUF4184 family protein n=1 Tax=unclassified Nocardiopsis TaxID=2649073 RepID=UPI00093E55A5|nr:DUF4184 family protein [Nocardiopsis sp. TSRI0078]OKI13558.1 hypothetical protein A6A08_14820 [Nocardiopsis sp. TSRI0078]
MPLTPSHAAAVLPLARTRLPLPALVVGSVAPDLPYYLPLPVAATTTHGLSGLWADVLLGGAVLAVYAYVLRAPLYALAGRGPAPPVRVPRSAGEAVRALALTAAALAVGAATHMAWDSFTQTGGALVRAWPVLSTPVVGPHLLHNVLVYAGSALGLAALAWWVRPRRGRRTVPHAARTGRGGPEAGGRVCTAALAAVAVCAAAGAVAGGLSERAAVGGYDLVRCLLVGALTGTGAGLVAWTAAWWARFPGTAR